MKINITNKSKPTSTLPGFSMTIWDGEIWDSSPHDPLLSITLQGKIPELHMRSMLKEILSSLEETLNSYRTGKVSLSMTLSPLDLKTGDGQKNHVNGVQ